MEGAGNVIRIRDAYIFRESEELIRVFIPEERKNENVAPLTRKRETGFHHG